MLTYISHNPLWLSCYVIAHSNSLYKYNPLICDPAVLLANTGPVGGDVSEYTLAVLSAALLLEGMMGLFLQHYNKSCGELQLRLYP